MIPESDWQRVAGLRPGTSVWWTDGPHRVSVWLEDINDVSYSEEWHVDQSDSGDFEGPWTSSRLVLHWPGSQPGGVMVECSVTGKHTTMRAALIALHAARQNGEPRTEVLWRLVEDHRMRVGGDYPTQEELDAAGVTGALGGSW